jgi:hypothetical protein
MYKMFTSTRDKTEAVWNVHEVNPSESDAQRVGHRATRTRVFVLIWGCVLGCCAVRGRIQI